VVGSVSVRSDWHPHGLELRNAQSGRQAGLPLKGVGPEATHELATVLADANPIELTQHLVVGTG
jgi:hypothetical protein